MLLIQTFEHESFWHFKITVDSTQMFKFYWKKNLTFNFSNSDNLKTKLFTN